MIECMRKLSLRSILDSERIVEKRDGLLRLIEKTDFKRLSNRWGSRWT